MGGKVKANAVRYGEHCVCYVEAQKGAVSRNSLIGGFIHTADAWLDRWGRKFFPTL
jgi:hypothetical protein